MAVSCAASSDSMTNIYKNKSISMETSEGSQKKYFGTIFKVAGPCKTNFIFSGRG